MGLLDRLDESMEDLDDRLDRIMGHLTDHIDTVFGVGTSSTTRSHATRRWARHKVEKGANKVTVWIEVPGLTSKDVTLTLEDQVLKVVAKGSPVAGYEQHVMKEFRVSEDLDPNKIEAKVKDGLLTITLHSKPEADKPKAVKIPVT